MAHESDDNGLEFTVGLACGLAAGVALALLLAPAPGRETRAWVARQGREARRRAGELLHTPEMNAIIRRSGLLGLADVLRANRSPAE
jgi:gas vesicle protein